MPTEPKKRATLGGTLSSSRGSLMDHLATADAFVRIADQVYRLQRLQALLDATLPAHLLPGTRIANLTRGILIIHAPSGAVAAKIRQLAPSLAAGFVQQGVEITAIRVRVQARRTRTPSGGRRRPNHLGTRPKQALASLAAGLAEDSALRQALYRLLRNA